MPRNNEVSLDINATTLVDNNASIADNHDDEEVEDMTQLTTTDSTNPTYPSDDNDNYNRSRSRTLIGHKFSAGNVTRWTYLLCDN